jgi:two-component sensor histidine kinase
VSRDSEYIRKLLRQQAALASFGSFALGESDLQTILTEAAKVCAGGLDVPFCKVCRYREAQHDLLIEAGFGWREGVIGNVVSRADTTTPQGRAFITGKPSICKDSRRDADFILPPFYAEHGVISTIDVVISGSDGHGYGVLEIDSDHLRDFDQHDIDFLTGFANVLAEAVSTSARNSKIRSAMEDMESLVREKDRLLVQTRVLGQELQHRVRNNLQLIYSMLSRQLEDTKDPGDRRGLRSISRRVSTLAQVYDQLIGTEMKSQMDFGTYSKSLCANLAEFQAAPGGISLSCAAEEVILDLDVITSLGIIVAELVTNSYDHAFPDGEGAISVMLAQSPSSGWVTMTVADNGIGFVPRAGSRRHGLGLIKRLVEQIGGTIDLTSLNGTVWTIKFPVHVPAPNIGGFTGVGGSKSADASDAVAESLLTSPMNTGPRSSAAATAQSFDPLQC